MDATIKNYKTICNKLIEKYEKEYKKKFPKKLVEKFYNAQLLRIKNKKSLLSVIKYLTCIKNRSTEKAKAATMKNLEIMNKKNRESITEKQKEARKNNMKNVNKLQQTRRAAERNFKKMQEWRKNNPEEVKRISRETGKKFGPLTIYIARESLKKKKESGEIEYYKSKEEINCRNELEKALNITFDYKINKKDEKIYNIYIALPKNCKKLYGNSHSYDFGIKKYKLLIEYDGIYWHHSKKHNTEKRDKYWDKKAKDKGFTVYRINSNEWFKKDKKLLIIEEIRNIIKQLKSSRKTNK